MGDEEKLERFGKSFVKLTELTVNLIAECISHIDTPDGTVTDKQMISEFIHNCNKDLFETISKHVVSMKDQIELKSHIVSCSECTKEFTMPVTMDQANFFDVKSQN